jgi:hypothetical protein
MTNFIRRDAMLANRLASFRPVTFNLRRQGRAGRRKPPRPRIPRMRCPSSPHQRVTAPLSLRRSHYAASECHYPWNRVFGSQLPRQNPCFDALEFHLALVLETAALAATLTMLASLAA